jgi:hypothetical protein
MKGRLLENASSRLPSLLLPCLALLFLAACASRAPLPTRIAAAPTLILPPDSTATLAGADSANASGDSANASGDSATVPPTYTAHPLATPGHDDVAGQPIAATLAPSATPMLPTRTPLPTDTPTPTATATRYVSVLPDLPPTDELGPSKLGLHVVRNNDPAIMEFVRQAQPAVMKAVDDLGFLAEVKEVSPRTITIGRHSIKGSQDYDGDPEEEARRFVEEYLEIYRLNPAVDYWEGWNEPDPNYQNMIWYSRFEQERVRQMAAHGFRTAIGGFATGVPEMDEFQLFLPAIQAAIDHGGILTLHEYGAPDMAYLYGDPLPGYPAYPDRGSLTFRYRWFYREFLEPGGMVIPLVISEAGIDGIIGNRPGPPGLGWWDFQSYWERQGLGATGREAFINQLAWYDAGVRQDGYLIGFTVFTAGGFGYWEQYDINPLLPELAAYVVGQRGS